MRLIVDAKIVISALVSTKLADRKDTNILSRLSNNLVW
jgi:hypothetical protein